MAQTALTSKGAKWEWINVNQTVLKNMKKLVTREVLLSYPNFNKVFEAYTDTSATQLGTVISQEDCPIASTAAS